VAGVDEKEVAASGLAARASGGRGGDSGAYETEAGAGREARGPPPIPGDPQSRIVTTEKSTRPIYPTGLAGALPPRSDRARCPLGSSRRRRAPPSFPDVFSIKSNT